MQQYLLSEEEVCILVQAIQNHMNHNVPDGDFGTNTAETAALAEKLHAWESGEPVTTKQMVIDKYFGGDSERFLIAMACWLHEYRGYGSDGTETTTTQCINEFCHHINSCEGDCIEVNPADYSRTSYTIKFPFD